MGQVVREKIGNFTFIIRPTVFNPVDFLSSGIFADFILTLDLEGKEIMDMGCGSGIVSIIAASKGAKCLALDINPIAVRSVKETAELNKLSDKITVVESDLFEAVPSPTGRVREGLVPSSSESTGEGLFDIIFFNPPYYKGIPKNNFERAFKAGPDLEVIDSFLAGAGKFLPPGGVIYFIVSSDMDLGDLENRIKTSGFGFEIFKTNEKLLETFYIIKAVIS
jgi:release factor glutamine methyltransferase